jgi:hypothetical protein
MQRLATGAILVIGGAVVVAAMVSGLGGSHEPAHTTTPRPITPVVPTPADALQSLPAPAPGRLAGAIDLVTDGCAVKRLDLATGAVTTLEDGTGCRVWFSPAGDYLIASVPQATNPTVPLLRLQMTAGSPPRMTAVAQGVGSPAVADDGTAASCTGHRLRLDRLGQAPWSRGGLCPATALGRTIVAVDTSRTRIVAARSGTPLFDLPSAALGPGAMLVASSAARTLALVDPGTHGARLTRIDTASGRRLAPVVLAQRGPFTRVAISNDGGFVGLLTSTGWTVFDLRHHRVMRSAGGVPIDDVAFSPDSRNIAFATQAGVAVVDAATLAPRYLVPMVGFRIAWTAGFAE